MEGTPVTQEAQVAAAPRVSNADGSTHPGSELQPVVRRRGFEERAEGKVEVRIRAVGVRVRIRRLKGIQI